MATRRKNPVRLDIARGLPTDLQQQRSVAGVTVRGGTIVTFWLGVTHVEIDPSLKRRPTTWSVKGNPTVAMGQILDFVEVQVDEDRESPHARVELFDLNLAHAIGDSIAVIPYQWIIRAEEPDFTARVAADASVRKIRGALAEQEMRARSARSDATTTFTTPGGGTSSRPPIQPGSVFQPAAPSSLFTPVDDDGDAAAKAAARSRDQASPRKAGNDRSVKRSNKVLGLDEEPRAGARTLQDQLDELDLSPTEAADNAGYSVEDFVSYVIDWSLDMIRAAEAPDLKAAGRASFVRDIVVEATRWLSSREFEKVRNIALNNSRLPPDLKDEIAKAHEYMRKRDQSGDKAWEADRKKIAIRFRANPSRRKNPAALSQRSRIVYVSQSRRVAEGVLLKTVLGGAAWLIQPVDPWSDSLSAGVVIVPITNIIATRLDAPPARGAFERPSADEIAAAREVAAGALKELVAAGVKSLTEALAIPPLDLLMKIHYGGDARKGPFNLPAAAETEIKLAKLGLTWMLRQWPGLKKSPYRGTSNPEALFRFNPSRSTGARKDAEGFFKEFHGRASSEAIGVEVPPGMVGQGPFVVLGDAVDVSYMPGKWSEKGAGPPFLHHFDKGVVLLTTRDGKSLFYGRRPGSRMRVEGRGIVQ